MKTSYDQIKETIIKMIKDNELVFSLEKDKHDICLKIYCNGEIIQIATKPISNTQVSNTNASNGIVYLKSEHGKYCPVCGEKYNENDFKYINRFIDDEDSTWDELAKELCKRFPNEIEDFIWCLLDNLNEENKLEAVNMVCNMKI